MMTAVCAGCDVIVRLNEEIQTERGILCKKCEKSAVCRYEVLILPGQRKFKRYLKRPPARPRPVAVRRLQEPKRAVA